MTWLAALLILVMAVILIAEGLRMHRLTHSKGQNASQSVPTDPVKTALIERLKAEQRRADDVVRKNPKACP